MLLSTTRSYNTTESVAMKEYPEDRETLSAPKSGAKIYLGYLTAVVFAFVSLAGSVVILAFIFVLLYDCGSCHSPNELNEDGESTNLEAVLGFIVVPLCIIGGLTNFGGKMSFKPRSRITNKRLE